MVPHGYRFITDTASDGQRHPATAPSGSYAGGTQGIRLITDTLGGNGGPASTALAASGQSFHWSDAGVGAATAAGSILVTVGGALVVLRRRRGLAF